MEMTYFLIAYFVIGLLLGFYTIGYSYHKIQRVDTFTLVMFLAWTFSWPALFAIGVGIAVGERSERVEKMKQEHDEAKARVQAELNKGKK